MQATSLQPDISQGHEGYHLVIGRLVLAGQLIHQIADDTVVSVSLVALTGEVQKMSVRCQIAGKNSHVGSTEGFDSQLFGLVGQFLVEGLRFCFEKQRQDSFLLVRLQPVADLVYMSA